jgi:uncharacterized damage-inducible protein DinB
MDRRATVQRLWDFHAWARPLMLRAASELTAEQLRMPGSVAGGLGVGSVHDVLSHVVGAEEIWVRRWEGQERAPLPGGDDYADLGAIEERWSAVERDRFLFLGSLDDDDLDREVRYVSITRGVEEAVSVVADDAPHHEPHDPSSGGGLHGAHCPRPRSR